LLYVLLNLTCPVAPACRSEIEIYLPSYIIHSSLSMLAPPYSGPRAPRRLWSASSSCSASRPGFSSPPFPNNGLPLPLLRGGSGCRVCSGGTDAELTKVDKFRLPSSIQENPASDRDGRIRFGCVLSAWPSGFLLFVAVLTTPVVPPSVRPVASRRA
jgi:hypothetical protein